MSKRARLGSVDPGDYVGIVGRSFLQHERAPVLVIGPHEWSRYRLGLLGCPHPKAAAALNRVIQTLSITSISGLAKHAREIGSYKDIGVTAYWLVLAILKDAGWDVLEVHGEAVSHATIKARARKIAQRERPRLRKKARRAGPPSEAAEASL